MGNRLYVGNLSYGTTELELRELFGQMGTVADAKVVMDRETGRPRGFAFVEMSSAEEALKAIEQINGRELDGRLGLLQQSLERRALQLLRPAQAYRRLALQHAEVRPDPLPALSREHLREAVLLDALDAPHARPPARLVVGIGEHAPDRLGRGREHPTDARHRHAAQPIQVSRRRCAGRGSAAGA